MRNVALLIEYDGTDYSGWQIQANSGSIQETIESALSGILQEKIRVTGAGRTDAGVHAVGQVANFHTRSVMPLNKIGYALNSVLPEAIAIRNFAEVPHDFHSRFDAVARSYDYGIRTQKSPISRRYTAFFPYDFSLASMNEAASYLIGKKNFRSFTKYADQQKHYICNVARAQWEITTDERQWKLLTDRVPGLLHDQDRRLQGRANGMCFTIQADRFLHGMVRSIVGTLIDVGRSRITIEDFRRIVDTRDRSCASMSAPACGLFLTEISYGFNIWDSRAQK